uniref:Ubiquitin-like domain-containing protein n=1 Tax=Oncorhynchus tshawytscha TaxID=74940 RepID=A0AAZ3Q9C5_ONCTS
MEDEKSYDPGDRILKFVNRQDDINFSRDAEKRVLFLKTNTTNQEDTDSSRGGDPETMRLIFTDKQLEDPCLLSSYGIQSQSVIQIVLRVPGGWRE